MLATHFGSFAALSKATVEELSSVHEIGDVIAEGLKLRRVRVMGAHRIELSDFSDTMRDRLRAYGLFSEIISLKLRMFVPTDDSGVGVLAKVLDRYPVQHIGEREVA